MIYTFTITAITTRFGRVVWQAWKKTDGTAHDRYFYGYDRASNRLWRAERQNLLTPTQGQESASRDEAYQYDGLHRLVKAQRGSRVLVQSGDLLCPIGGDADTDALCGKKIAAGAESSAPERGAKKDVTTQLFAAGLADPSRPQQASHATGRKRGGSGGPPRSI